MKARLSLLAAVALVCLWSVSAPARAEERESLKPPVDATLVLHAKHVSAVVGFAWGAGTLTYREKTHEVKVDGLTVGAVGASAIEARGEVFYLAKLEDFAGKYTAVAGGVTPGVGVGALVMRNEKGVEVRLLATTKGISLSMATSGVTLAFAK
jgi:hypothetical protein